MANKAKKKQKKITIKKPLALQASKSLTFKETGQIKKSAIPRVAQLLKELQDNDIIPSTLTVDDLLIDIDSLMEVKKDRNKERNKTYAGQTITYHQLRAHYLGNSILRFIANAGFSPEEMVGKVNSMLGTNEGQVTEKDVLDPNNWTFGEEGSGSGKFQFNEAVFQITFTYNEDTWIDRIQ